MRSHFFRAAPLVLPVGFLVLWELGVRLTAETNILVPPPSQVFSALFGLIRTGTLFDHIGRASTGSRQAMCSRSWSVYHSDLRWGTRELADRLFGGTVNGLRPIPASAWIPISIILMGIGDRPAIFLVFIGTVWSIILNSSHGVRAVPKHLVWAAQTMGAKKRTIFTKVVFPAALPSVFTGMRIAVGVAFTCVIVAELIAVRSGLGYLITEARMIVRSDIVIAGMIAIGASAMHSISWSAS